MNKGLFVFIVCLCMCLCACNGGKNQVGLYETEADEQQMAFKWGESHTFISNDVTVLFSVDEEFASLGGKYGFTAFKRSSDIEELFNVFQTGMKGYGFEDLIDAIQLTMKNGEHVSLGDFELYYYHTDSLGELSVVSSEKEGEAYICLRSNDEEDITRLYRGIIN